MRSFFWRVCWKIESILVVSMLLCGGALTAATAADEKGPSAAATSYSVVTYNSNQISEVLDEDAAVLNLQKDVLEKSTTRDWMIASGLDFEIRRHLGTGFLSFIRIGADKSGVGKDSTRFAHDELRERAVMLLQQFGLEKGEIREVVTRDLIASVEDENGSKIGEDKVKAVIVSVSRQINGIPVIGSSGQVVFNTSGEVVQATLFWRKLSGVTAQACLRPPSLLEAEKSVQAEQGSAEVVDRGVFYAFVENYFRTPQDWFDLKYVATVEYFSEDGFSSVDMIVLDATNPVSGGSTVE